MELNGLKKEIICDKIYRLTEDWEDNELEYAIYLMNFWLNERKRQNEELEEIPLF